MAETLQTAVTSGELQGAGFRFCIVVSRFNSFITDRLLTAAMDALERSGVKAKGFDVTRPRQLVRWSQKKMR